MFAFIDKIIEQNGQRNTLLRRIAVAIEDTNLLTPQLHERLNQANVPHAASVLERVEHLLKMLDALRKSGAGQKTAAEK